MVRINLLPVRVSKKKEAGKQQLVLFVMLLVGGLVGNMLWNNSRSSDLAAREKHLAKTKADIAAIEKIIGEVTSIRSEQKALRDKLEVLETLKRGRSGPVRMLDELATIIPKRVWLKKLTEANGRIAFEGSAVSLEDVSAFMTALKSSQHFKQVELKQTGRAGGKASVDFSIDCSVNFATDAAAAPVAGG